MLQEWRRDPYRISTDTHQLDLVTIHDFLTVTSYWAEGIPLETVERSLEHSLNFGLYKQDQQIGFARVITDYATFAYLTDVFVLEPFRGQGLSKWVLDVITTHSQLQGLRRWMLITKDAHELYRQFGFTDLTAPERYMECLFPDIYKKTDASELRTQV